MTNWTRLTELEASTRLMVNSLRTADVSAPSSLLRDVSQRPSTAMNDEKRLPFAGYTTRLVFVVLLAWEQGGGGGGRGVEGKNIGERNEPRIVVWGGERVVEPNVPLMPQNPPCNDLLCQDVKFSRMSA